MRASKAAGTQAVARAFAVLRAFSDQTPAWRLADLSRTAGLSRPTTLRLLGALEREDMVSRMPERNLWCLGVAAIELGALARRSLGLSEAARGTLEALAAETGDTAGVDVLIGHEVLVLDEAQGPYRSSTSPCIGSRWPAHAVSSGKVLLAAAYADDTDAWHEFLSASGTRLPRFTARTITTRKRLEAELRRVQRQGFATATEELEAGYAAVAAPVTDHRGRVVAAVSVGGPVLRFSQPRRARAVARILAAGREISARLGPLEPGSR
jgi:DNA-binding IclR family transcriptional regulator